MSNTEELKKYLIGKDGFLLNPDNNGKTIMLSGAWGAGKTHFWQNEIERKQQKINGKDKFSKKDYQEGLSYSLNEKACVYVSLYGKDNLVELKNEVLFKASAEKDFLSEDIEAFGFEALSTLNDVGSALGAVYKVAMNINESRRDEKGTNKLKKGGVICFDDFERKSKEIDLNDLFGFISQLAISLKCKVIIILNSDVFTGKEKTIFSQVKEKTVSKYLFFDPTVESLFDIVFKEYDSLKQYKEKIKSAFKEVDIVNARIFIQTLDNIQEWVQHNKSLIGDGNVLRYFVFVNINFILNHHIVKVKLTKVDKNREAAIMSMLEDGPSPSADYEDHINVNVKNNGLEYKKIDEYISEDRDYNENFIENLKQRIKDREKSNSSKSGKYDNSEGLIEFIDNNESFVKSLHFIYTFNIHNYGYSHNKAEVDVLDNINTFIETGII